jgi:hypothetical protein
MTTLNSSSSSPANYQQQKSTNSNYSNSYSIGSVGGENGYNNYNHYNSKQQATTTVATIDDDIAKENMRLIFEQFDKDCDGKITKNELNFVMCNLFPEETITEQDINDMLDAADLDRNGFIDFNEFANMFKLFNSNTSNEIAR